VLTKRTTAEFLFTQDIYLPKVVHGHFKIALEVRVAPAKKNVIGAIISRMAD
jgi:hypothetical protein